MKALSFLMRRSRKPWLPALVLCGMLTDCDRAEKTASAPSDAPPAQAGILESYSAADGDTESRMLAGALPPAATAALATLLEQEQSWLVKPPPDVSPALLDQQFAELRWKISEVFGLHDVRSAISYARASLSDDAAHPERWERLGDLLNLSGDPASAQQAAAAYDNAVFLAPKSPSPRQKLVAALLMLKQPRNALIHLECCLFMVNETEERTLVPVYAASCAAAGEFKRGIAFLKALAEAEGGTAQHRVAWAVLEKGNGNRDQALKLLAEAQSGADATSPLARYAATLQKRYEGEKGGSK